MSAGSVYIAGPLGFFAAGRDYHERVVIPALCAAEFEPLDPWGDASVATAFAAAAELSDTQERVAALERINQDLGARNARWIAQCNAVLALLDGADVDSGTAAEIGYAAAMGKPVIGVRSDMRLSGDNEAAPVNLQVVYFVEASGGRIVRTLTEGVDVLRTVLA